MKFVVVDELPKNRRGGAKPRFKHEYNSVRTYLEEFVNMDVKYVRVEFNEGEYSSLASLRTTLYDAIARTPDMPVKAVLRDGCVYLIRTDM
jgi:hypothetical protein